MTFLFIAHDDDLSHNHSAQSQVISNCVDLMSMQSFKLLSFFDFISIDRLLLFVLLSFLLFDFYLGVAIQFYFILIDSCI